jgi:hypothetical protein
MGACRAGTDNKNVSLDERQVVEMDLGSTHAPVTTPCLLAVR